MEDRVGKIMEMAKNLDDLNEFFRNNDSVVAYLDIKITKMEEGHCEFSLPFSEGITRAGNVLHGGMIMAALDYAGGLTAMTVNDGIDQVTQELKINFLSPMHKGPFKIVTDIIKPGRTAVIIETKLYDNNGKLGTIALGTWYIIRDRIIEKK